MNRITRKSWLPLLLLGTLIAICFLMGVGRADPAKAKVQDGSVRFITYSGTQLFSLAPEQKAEFCVGTVSARGPDVTWGGFITDNTRIKLFQLPEKSSPAGTWTCSQVLRNALPTSGDAAGRVKVAATLFMRVPAGTKSSDFLAQFDLTDTAGTTLAGGSVPAIIIAATQDNDF